jgi:hydroxymethylpyrimidine pyrophosphatase-like HAD family hydrolase
MSKGLGISLLLLQSRYEQCVIWHSLPTTTEPSRPTVRLNDVTIQALKRLHATGRKLILVSGRVLADLERVLPRTDLCEVVVAEGSALSAHRRLEKP